MFAVDLRFFLLPLWLTVLSVGIVGRSPGAQYGETPLDPPSLVEDRFNEIPPFIQERLLTPLKTILEKREEDLAEELELAGTPEELITIAEALLELNELVKFQYELRPEIDKYKRWRGGRRPLLKRLSIEEDLHRMLYHHDYNEQRIAYLTIVLSQLDAKKRMRNLDESEQEAVVKLARMKRRHRALLEQEKDRLLELANRLPREPIREDIVNKTRETAEKKIIALMAKRTEILDKVRELSLEGEPSVQGEIRKIERKLADLYTVVMLRLIRTQPRGRDHLKILLLSFAVELSALSTYLAAGEFNLVDGILENPLQAALWVSGITAVRYLISNLLRKNKRWNPYRFYVGSAREEIISKGRLQDQIEGLRVLEELVGTHESANLTADAPPTNIVGIYINHCASSIAAP
jgi:hypothetical protein